MWRILHEIQECDSFCLKFSKQKSDLSCLFISFTGSFIVILTLRIGFICIKIDVLGICKFLLFFLDFL